MPVPSELAGPPPGRGHPPSGPRIVKLPGGRGFGIVSGPGVSAFYGLLRAVNLRVLEDTAKVEAEFIAAVVIIDVIRRRLRRHHRARRAAQSESRAVPSGDLANGEGEDAAGGGRELIDGSS